MRRTVIALVLMLSMALGSAVPVTAILYGGPDGNDHPYVGLVVFFDSSGQRLHRCSGTLLSATVFLTAGHCTAGTASARIWFDAALGPGSGYPDSGGVTGTPYTDPGFDDAAIPNRRDVGVVILDTPPPGVASYGTLPALGVLDDLAARRGPNYPTFTVVGYGYQGVKPDLLTATVRYQGTTKLVNLQSALTDGFNLQISSDPGQWSGGICFGDSGGPVLIAGTNVVAAIDSFVKNTNCTGSGFAYRADIPDAQTFISSFLH
jgi:trypsin